MLSACGGGDTESAPVTAPSENTVCASTDATDDLLADICDSGTITVSTDPKYPPQSSLDQKTGEYVGFDIDTAALQDLALGDGTRLDAVITSATTAQGYVDSGRPVKTVGEPVFYEPLAAAFDKNAELDPTSLVEAVNGIVKEMHSDGTLGAASKEWYDGLDLSVQQ